MQMDVREVDYAAGLFGNRIWGLNYMSFRIKLQFLLHAIWQILLVISELENHLKSILTASFVLIPLFKVTLIFHIEIPSSDSILCHA